MNLLSALTSHKKKGSLQRNCIQERKKLLHIVEQHLEFPFCQDVSAS